jgi:hypothetical protein
MNPQNMKKAKHTVLVTMVLSGMMNLALFAQETKSELNLSLGYFDDNDRLQYLKANTKSKINGRFQPVPGISLSFYLGSESPSSLLGKGTTNSKGEAVVFIPASAAEEWKKSQKHEFLALSEASPSYEATRSTIEVTRAKITIDTGENRKVIATLLEWKEGKWIPVKGVDLTVSVKRLGSNLGVSDAPTYTTDSTGAASANFKLADLPGDASGNIILVSRLEDNDTYGNLSFEKTVPWGTSVQYVSDFDKRSLYARRGRTPAWLGITAWSVALAVWGVLIFLLFQIRKIRKLGKA